MRKLIISLTLAALLTLSTALVAFADGDQDDDAQGELVGAEGTDAQGDEVLVNNQD